MGAEIKTSGVKVESRLSASLHRKFKAACKKDGTSAAQRIRDLIQRDLKISRATRKVNDAIE